MRFCNTFLVRKYFFTFFKWRENQELLNACSSASSSTSETRNLLPLQESVSSASTPVSSARGSALRSGRGSGSGVASSSGASRARVTVTPTYTAPRLAAIVLGRGVIEHYQVRDGQGVRKGEKGSWNCVSPSLIQLPG